MTSALALHLLLYTVAAVSTLALAVLLFAMWTEER